MAQACAGSRSLALYCGPGDARGATFATGPGGLSPRKGNRYGAGHGQRRTCAAGCAYPYTISDALDHAFANNYADQYSYTKHNPIANPYAHADRYCHRYTYGYTLTYAYADQAGAYADDAADAAADADATANCASAGSVGT